MVGRLLNTELERQGKRSLWINFEYHPRILLKVVTNTTGYLRQVSRYEVRNSWWDPHEHNSEAVPFGTKFIGDPD
jgi:hypothetical protein